MKIAGIAFRAPTFLKLLFFVIECTIPVLMLFGIRVAIADGSVANEPELLRGIMFGLFSPALCLRVCYLFGWRENRWRGRALIFLLFYPPIGFLLAKLSGVL